jgi:hypothetical protein
LELLLEKNSAKRKGGMLCQFKCHQWFELDWELLSMKTIAPPCKAIAKPREVSRSDLMHIISRDE